MTTQTDSRQIPIYSRPDIHGIDPLTGYFCSSIFVATLVGNNGLGPVLDLKLHYLPNQNGEGCDAGFGDWRFRFSHARKEPHNEEKTGKIFLNDAEVWKWDGQSNIYLPTAIIKNNASEKKLSIAYKNGQTEILDGSFSTRLMGGIDFNIYLPERIISPLGNELIIKWETPTGPQNAFPRLSSISDESKTLLSATYTQKENKLTATLTVFPDTLESYTVTFETDTETVGLSPNTPVHLKKTYNSKTDSTTEYSHETVVASKYQKSALIKKITYNSSATEDITYTEGKVSKHIITDSNKILVQSNAYTYKSNNGTLITSVTDLDKKTVDHHYTSNGLPIKEATFLNGLLVKVVEVERAEVIDKALQTSASKDVIPVGLQVTTTTTYSNASPFTRTERSVIRFDTLGNIISKTENGITTEWTYYQGMPKEEDLVTTKHIQSKGFFLLLQRYLNTPAL